eukprot:GDKJ01019248.1.p1 GENE.GDKJ01019248.1~~GDKJ01019248.1.p1  ORF type:complete len:461 (-),score=67.39 GDKJ01019248.1:48-1430(-)
MVRVFFLRHGVASHNEACNNRAPGVKRTDVFLDMAHFDAKLTENGKKACIATRSTGIPDAVLTAVSSGNYTAYVSTLTRTIETLRCVLPEVKKVEALDCLREWSGLHVCDSRETVTNLKNRWSSEFEQFTVTAPQEEDHLSYHTPRETPAQLQMRCFEFAYHIHSTNSSIRVDPENHVIIAVSHSALLRMMMGAFGLKEPEHREVKNNQWIEVDIPLDWTPDHLLITPLPFTLNSKTCPIDFTSISKDFIIIEQNDEMNQNYTPFDLLLDLDSNDKECQYQLSPYQIEKFLLSLEAGSGDFSLSRHIDKNILHSVQGDANGLEVVKERLMRQLKNISFCTMPSSMKSWAEYQFLPSDCDNKESLQLKMRLVNACPALVDRGMKKKSSHQNHSVVEAIVQEEVKGLNAMAGYEIDKKNLLLGMINLLIVDKSVDMDVCKAVAKAIRGAGALGVICMRIPQH